MEGGYETDDDHDTSSSKGASSLMSSAVEIVASATDPALRLFAALAVVWISSYAAR
jgi:hypothetical protein